MAAVVSREAYFDTGLAVLADLGYAGLKLAEVCRRLGVTSGSFYHYFSSWSAYTTALVADWQGRTEARIAALLEETDPRERIDNLVEVSLALPHGSEAAIRVWSALDPQVRAAQQHVDRRRFEVISDAATEVLGDRAPAELFARSAIYILVGYEQTTLTPDPASLARLNAMLVNALDAGRFSPARE